MKLCLDCGKEKSQHGNYCKTCGYKHRIRPKGLIYNIKQVNKGWIKKGQYLNPEAQFRKGETPWNKGIKGTHFSPETEFKYKNGNGYRYLFGKGILPKKCKCCGETNIKRLHVHHKDHRRENNNINNLEVLCRPHHLKVHNRTERQYVEGRKAI